MAFIVLKESMLRLLCHKKSLFKRTRNFGHLHYPSLKHVNNSFRNAQKFKCEKNSPRKLILDVVPSLIVSGFFSLILIIYSANYSVI